MIRIAIVDDHEIVREGLKSILQGEPDFEVVAESDTAAGLVSSWRKPNPMSSCSMHGFPASAELKLVADLSQHTLKYRCSWSRPTPTTNWSKSAFEREQRVMSSKTSSASASKRASER